MVLMSYISLHLINHMLGIVSLTLAEAGLRLSILLWQSVPGTSALYGAFALHFALALRTIYQRRDGICRPRSGCVCGRASAFLCC